MASIKDRITLHVIDTGAGLAASGLHVLLHCTDNPQEIWFTRTTNPEGRIDRWSYWRYSDGPAAALEEVLEQFPTGNWKFGFHTGLYFGEGIACWPELEFIIPT